MTKVALMFHGAVNDQVNDHDHVNDEGPNGSF
jgi:hypothetical protein